MDNRFKVLLVFVSLVMVFHVIYAQEVTVIGQPDATTNTPGHSASQLRFPLGLSVDKDGGIYVADRDNHRVLYFAADGDGVADRVYGQHGNFDSYIVNYDGAGGSGMPSADTLNNPAYAALDSQGGLYVADRDNHRVLYYAPDGDTTADRVYGQYGSFTLNVVNNDGSGLISGTGAPSADNLGVYALTLALDASGALYIADSSNHRVLYFAADGDTTADRVYGQFGSFNSGVKNNDGTGKTGRPSADSLNFPRGMVFDTSGGVYIADRDNNRVLYFAADGDTTADRVYGQHGNFNTNIAKNNGDAAIVTPAGDTLSSPRSLALDDGGGLYVTDSLNHRLLYFAPDGDANADWIFGQAGSYITGVANNDGTGASGVPGPENLNAPQGLALAGGKLYISDTGNNRILIIPAPTF